MFIAKIPCIIIRATSSTPIRNVRIKKRIFYENFFKAMHQKRQLSSQDQVEIYCHHNCSKQLLAAADLGQSRAKETPPQLTLVMEGTRCTKARSELFADALDHFLFRAPRAT